MVVDSWWIIGVSSWMVDSWWLGSRNGCLGMVMGSWWISFGKFYGVGGKWAFLARVWRVVSWSLANAKVWYKIFNMNILTWGWITFLRPFKKILTKLYLIVWDLTSIDTDFETILPQKLANEVREPLALYID